MTTLYVIYLMSALSTIYLGFTLVRVEGFLRLSTLVSIIAVSLLPLVNTIFVLYVIIEKIKFEDKVIWRKKK